MSYSSDPISKENKEYDYSTVYALYTGTVYNYGHLG
jgi:hypothetical protein